METMKNTSKKKLGSQVLPITKNSIIETRIKCDASSQGLGAAFERQTHEGWQTLAIASQILRK